MYRWLTLPWRGEFEVVVSSALTQNLESLGRMVEMLLVDRGANVTVEEGRVRFNTGVFGLLSDGGLSVLDAGCIEFSTSGRGVRVRAQYVALRFSWPLWPVAVVAPMLQTWLVCLPLGVLLVGLSAMRWRAVSILRNDIVAVLSASGDGRRERAHE